jgi:hypothetical protein
MNNIIEKHIEFLALWENMGIQDTVMPVWKRIIDMVVK